jgi:hypothetical protein
LDEEEEYLIEISDRDARDGETYINMTDYPKLYLEKWNFDIQNRTRNAYIKKWGLNRYYNIVMQSNRYKGLKEWEVLRADTGYFADPARKSDTMFSGEAMPTIWSLLKQNRIGAASTFYPVFFWRTRGLTLIFVLLNSFLKKGLIYSVPLLGEYIGWKIKNIILKPVSKNPEFISLRKLLRRKLIPGVPDDSPSMALLRKGR